MTTRASRFGSSRPRDCATSEEALGRRDHHRCGHEQRRAKGGQEREGGPPGNRHLGDGGRRLLPSWLESVPSTARDAHPRGGLECVHSSMAADTRRATTFLLAALVWSLGLFTFLRARGWKSGSSFPSRNCRAEAADYYAGRPTAPIAVTLECSGADVLALCLAAIFACPVSWRARLAGSAGAVAFVLGLNTVRIATLGRAAASPALFSALHLQVWPAILMLATAGYVFVWMRTRPGNDRAAGEAMTPTRGALSPLVRRFAPRAAVLLVAFALCGPWIARSEALVEVGAWTAGTAAFFITAAGLAAAASGNVLETSRGAFMVTPECLATALVPLYVAGVLTVRTTWPRRALALAAAPLLFTSLAVARLLLLAVPPVLVASPLFLVHGFHQLVLAVICVVLFALWREPPASWRWARAARRAGAALGAAAILAIVAGAALTQRGARRRAGRRFPGPAHADGADHSGRRPGGARPPARLPGGPAARPRDDGPRGLAAPPVGLRRAARLPGRAPRGPRTSWRTTRVWWPTRSSCGRGPWGCRSSSRW